MTLIQSGVPQSVLSASYVASQADADRAKDIKLLQMRGALDPKRFYKVRERWGPVALCLVAKCLLTPSRYTATHRRRGVVM